MSEKPEEQSHLEYRNGHWRKVAGHAHNYLVEQNGRWARCTVCPRRIEVDPNPVTVRFSPR